jgi:hypothetical protein
MSEPQRAPGSRDCPIAAFCRRAEEIVRRSVEECRNDRRTLAYREQFPRVDAERESLRALSLTALQRGAGALPPIEMERRLDAVLLACQALLYEIPLRHRCGDPPGLASLEQIAPAAVAEVLASDDERLRMLERVALEAIEKVEKVSLMLRDASGADSSPAGGHGKLRPGRALPLMDLATLLEAPIGTPEPLQNVYGAVAEAIRVAGGLQLTMARQNSPDVDSFAAAALALTSVWSRARAAVLAEERWLRAHAQEAFGAFIEALEEVERVNHACGHVLSALVGSKGWNELNWPRKAYAGNGSKACDDNCQGRRFDGDVAVYFAGLPSLPEHELLERMRQATVQAGPALPEHPPMTSLPEGGAWDHSTGLGLPTDVARACAAACECAEAAANLHLSARTRWDTVEKEAQWACNQARHLWEKLLAAAVAVEGLAPQLARRQPEPVEVGGLYGDSYHAAAIEWAFRLLNNARIAAGYEPIFPRMGHPKGIPPFLHQWRQYPAVLEEVRLQGWDHIATRWEDVRQDLAECFIPFSGARLVSLIRKEAALFAGGVNGEVPQLPRLSLQAFLASVEAAWQRCLGDVTPAEATVLARTVYLHAQEQVKAKHIEPHDAALLGGLVPGDSGLLGVSAARELVRELRARLIAAGHLTPDAATEAKAKPPRRPLPPARHGPDFRSVHWFGTDYSFTAGQAAIVAIPWGAWENETPDVAHETLLGEAGLETKRLVVVFKDHPAWGTMIVGGQSKGTARLQQPNQ